MDKKLAKIIRPSLLLVGALVCQQANAVEINVSPLAILSGEFAPTLLFDVGDENFRAGPVFGYSNSNGEVSRDSSIYNGEVSSLLVGAAMEYNSKGYNQSGLYGALNFVYSYGTLKFGDDSLACEIESNVFNTAATTGYAWRFTNGLSVKLGGGIGAGFAGDNSGECSDGDQYSASSSGIDAGIKIDASFGFSL